MKAEGYLINVFVTAIVTVRSNEYIGNEFNILLTGYER